jgi:hypothetical protein
MATETQSYLGGGARRLDDPRGVYLYPTDGTTQATVGRLTLQHLVDGVAREVSRHYRFRSGDRFRFLVSANRAGWLYVLHHSGEGPARLLWPASSDPSPQANRLLPHVPALVPAPPAVFVFDQEVGMEHFYVTIVSEPRAPSLSVAAETPASAAKPPTARPEASVAPQPMVGQETAPAPQRPVAGASDSSPPREPRIVQFAVRAHSGGMRIPSRGVVLDPNPQSGDPATYFSLLPKDAGPGLLFEFQLRHED